VPYRITESAPLGNPYSPYAQKKLAIEQRLMDLHHAGKLNITIVRPSHTICYSFPGVFIPDEHMALRMIQGKPVVSHGDGTGLWTLTRSEDFGRAFAKLLGNPKAFGEAFHITADQPHYWDSIFHTMAESLGTTAKLVHVPSDTLVKFNPKWAEPLQGDKSSCSVFDNSKVKEAVGGWECRHGMRETIQMSAPHVKKKLETYKPDMKLDALLDRIIEEQTRLGN
jgi:nucleoside-diphosphate-sugar epimerase